MTAWTRAWVLAATPCRPLMTFETVAMETPARAATARVGDAGGRHPQERTRRSIRTCGARATTATVASEIGAAAQPQYPLLKQIDARSEEHTSELQSPC